MTTRQRTRLRFARARWTAWLEHAGECGQCHSAAGPCGRGRSLYAAWETARDLVSEGDDAADGNA